MTHEYAIYDNRMRRKRTGRRERERERERERRREKRSTNAVKYHSS